MDGANGSPTCLTHSVAFVTAHCQESLDCLDWKSLAREKHTLAFYMPLARLDDLADGLIAHGRPAATPVAIIERGTSSEQRVIRATLGTLSEVNYAENIESPSILIVGEVTALQTSLHWFGPESNVPEQPGKPMSQGLVAVA